MFITEHLTTKQNKFAIQNQNIINFNTLILDLKTIHIILNMSFSLKLKVLGNQVK